jgi:hypothetical protein
MQDDSLRRCAKTQRIFVRLPPSTFYAEVRRVVENVCWVNGFEVDIPEESDLEIVDRIGDADALLADVTQYDPVVTHDVGVAHALGVPVLCVCHDQKKSHLADLEGLRLIYYGDLGSPTERHNMTRTLQRRLQLAISLSDRDNITDSFLERAQWITRDLEQLAADDNSESQTVWYSGFLSDFAVCEEGLEEGERSFKDSLLSQRQALVDLADKGFRLVCILSLPSDQNLILGNAEIVLIRLRCLLRFVENDDSGDTFTKRRIHWIISPYRQKNFYIIGNISCIERFQKAAARGVDLSLRLTNDASVRANTLAYRALFDKLLKAVCPPDLPDEAAILRFLREDSVRKVKTAVELCERLREDAK